MSKYDAFAEFRMDGHNVVVQLIPSAILFGKLQHAGEHGWHPLAMRTGVILKAAQRIDRIECLHDDDRAAKRLSRH